MTVFDESPSGQRTSGPVMSEIERKLKQAFAPLYLEVENESYKHSVPAGSESHFRVLVVSDKFASKTRVERSRLINSVLDYELKNGVHALSQRTYTADEWGRAGSEQNHQTPDCEGRRKS